MGSGVVQGRPRAPPPRQLIIQGRRQLGEGMGQAAAGSRGLVPDAQARKQQSPWVRTQGKYSSGLLTRPSLITSERRGRKAGRRVQESWRVSARGDTETVPASVTVISPQKNNGRPGRPQGDTGSGGGLSFTACLYRGKKPCNIKHTI